jgi:ABC-type bacteriocin/lantibiotic exporter with double-glycine peptidase domain
MLTAVSALAVAVVTAIGGVVTAVIGRRQPRGQQRRDDFTTIVTELRTNVGELKTELAEQKAASQRDRERITAQEFALRYIAGWARSLVTYMRQAQLEPPPPPQPVPEEARPFLHDVGL